MTFSKVAILGPGLLGGSLALALHERRLAASISIYGRSEKSLAAIRASGIASGLSTDPVGCVEDAEVILFCTPISVMPELAEAVRDAIDPFALVTDVGSVKAPVVHRLETIFGPGIRWVGSHPMAGSEQLGFSAARANLFEGAVTIVTPTEATAPDAAAGVSRLWEALGARVLTMDPATHDQLVAQISHLPHLVAAALAGAATEASWPLVGNGFLDTTRIAGGPPAMWADILLSNRAAVAVSLSSLIAILGGTLERLNCGDEKGLHELLAHANHVRSQMTANRS